MWTKQLIWVRLLIAFAILAAGCGAPIVAETTVGSVTQPVEATSTSTMDIQKSITEGANPVGESPSSTAVDVATTFLPALAYSPAWIEWQEIQKLRSNVDDDTLESTRIFNNYMSGNPNSISTPMGALCWSFHELSRSGIMGVFRRLLDDNMIPFLKEGYGVVSDQVGDPGPEATEAFLDLMSGDDVLVGSTDTGTGSQTVLPPGDNGDTGSVGSAGEIDNGNDGEFWELLRLEHEFAGDGTEWSNAVRAVAAPAMVAAFQAGEGLPQDVQVYADALIAFVSELVDSGLDVSTESHDLGFAEPNFPGFFSFVETAKYHQDCKRAVIDDVTGNVGSSSASTTTTTTVPPFASTTTTIQQTVEDTSPSTTSLTAPPSVTTTRPLADDAVPSSSRPTVPTSATTTQPQVEDPSPSTTTTKSAPAVDDSVTTTQPSVELPVSTTLPQVEDTSSSTTTTTPVLPVDDSVATPTTLPFGAGDPPSDDGGDSGLLDEEWAGG